MKINAATLSHLFNFLSSKLLEDFRCKLTIEDNRITGEVQGDNVYSQMSMVLPDYHQKKELWLNMAEMSWLKSHQKELDFKWNKNSMVVTGENFKYRRNPYCDPFLINIKPKIPKDLCYFNKETLLFYNTEPTTTIFFYQNYIYIASYAGGYTQLIETDTYYCEDVIEVPAYLLPQEGTVTLESFIYLLEEEDSFTIFSFLDNPKLNAKSYIKTLLDFEDKKEELITFYADEVHTSLLAFKSHLTSKEVWFGNEDISGSDDNSELQIKYNSLSGQEEFKVKFALGTLSAVTEFKDGIVSFGRIPIKDKFIYYLDEFIIAEVE